MVDCSQFLEGYSEFCDGKLEDARREAFEHHRIACESCARYDRVIRRGVELFRELPPATPSADFLPRLQHRIFHVDEERLRERQSSASSLLILALVATALAATAWLPMAGREPPLVQLPAIAAKAPPPPEIPLLFRTGPLLTSTENSTTWTATPAPSANTLFFRYSPMGSASGSVLPARYPR